MSNYRHVYVRTYVRCTLFGVVYMTGC